MSGIATLSIELELGWGIHDKHRYDHLSKEREAETKALDRLLDLADRLEIPITFNVVGHLFHHSCSGTHAGPHPAEWWEEDPGTNVETDPLFYAPDLIASIRETRIDHELATHTYSHLLADDASSSELADELAKVKDLHREQGLVEPDSVVMPRHQHAKYSLLTEHDLSTIRIPVEEYRKSFSNPVSKAWWILTRDHPLSTKRRRSGLLETTVTPHPSLTAVYLRSGQSSPHPAFSAIPRKIRQWLHRRYLVDAIDRAVENNGHVHLWTHVFNFANDSQWEPMRGGLEHLARRRDEDGIRVCRMQDLSAEEPN